MLKLKDLENRVYRGKECIRFEYIIQKEDRINNKPELIATFKKVVENEWQMQIVFNRTRDKDHDVYNFAYIMPKSGLPLELIAATGLRFFQLTLKEEIQNKSNLDFALGDVLQGM